METKRISKAAGFFACVTVGIFTGLLINPFYQIAASITIGRSIQPLYSPSRNHKAVLLRKHNLADFNFIVKVDGDKVYQSPDLCGGGDHSFRETLVWDKTGQVVILELMGKRVFAYDAVNKRNLEKGELNQYEFSPMPGDYFCIYLRDIDE